MGNQKSREQFRAETPGSALETRMFGTTVIGTAAMRLKFDKGTLRLTRNAGTVRYVTFNQTFSGTPLLSIRVGSSNLPAGSAYPIPCRITDTRGSFRIALSSYKRGTVVVHWDAYGI
jgi:hypothetical protein